MSKVPLNDLDSLVNQTTAISTINANNAAIEEGFNNTISRDGTSPNTMEAQIDMNQNRLVNVPLVPLSNGDVATKYYVDLRAGDLSDTTPTNPSDAIVEGNLTVNSDLIVLGTITGSVDLTSITDLAQVSTDNAAVRFDGTLGHTQNSGIIIDDSNNVSGIVGLSTTTIDLGSTDTTLARTSAGDITVEGNLVYRAGGTDVPVTDGGTGLSSATAYAVLCGGTTSTGAFQSIASVGTAAQVLTSNGAGALPTFQASGSGVVSMSIQRFTSGSGTYTPTANTRFIRVRIVAGGGGGGAVATNNGTDGGTTSFESWTAIGGTKGLAAQLASSGAGGAGGTGGATGTGTLVSRFDGQQGGHGVGSGTSLVSGRGGSSAFFGGGAPEVDGSTAGLAGKANSGGGGSGGSQDSSNFGSGGGAGESIEFYMTSAQIGASLSYAVGAAGTGGAAGTQAGGNGAAGIIIVEEYI